jgi:hypothetical protein
MTCTLLGMGFTFVITVAAVGFLGWLGLRRLMGHFKGNPEGTRSFVEHVLLPLFGPKAEEDGEEPSAMPGQAANKPCVRADRNANQQRQAD